MSKPKRFVQGPPGIGKSDILRQIPGVEDISLRGDAPESIIDRLFPQPEKPTIILGLKDGRLTLRVPDEIAHYDVEIRQYISDDEIVEGEEVQTDEKGTYRIVGGRVGE